MRVLSLESRRAKEMTSLILRAGGEPFVAPSVKERVIEDDDTAFRFVERLEADEFVGHLHDRRRPQPASRPRQNPHARRASRGCAPPSNVVIPEPNTWKETADAVAGRAERRLAVQEYGRPNRELNEPLKRLGASVIPVALYRWQLPDDMAPLYEAARRLASRECDVMIFTSRRAVSGIEEAVRASLAGDVAIASTGPVMTSALTAAGFSPDIVAKHPKMWALVKAAADESVAVLSAKR